MRIKRLKSEEREEFEKEDKREREREWEWGRERGRERERERENLNTYLQKPSKVIIKFYLNIVSDNFCFQIHKFTVDFNWGKAERERGSDEIVY